MTWEDVKKEELYKSWFKDKKLIENLFSLKDKEYFCPVKNQGVLYTIFLLNTK